jgi:hypothetical protein
MEADKETVSMYQEMIEGTMTDTKMIREEEVLVGIEEDEEVKATTKEMIITKVEEEEAVEEEAEATETTTKEMM